jgi:hypothetical protein
MMATKTELARRLRRNQTDAERLLWLRLRDRRFGLGPKELAGNGLVCSLSPKGRG